MSVIDLTGRRGLVAGIANVSSIAYGCAKAFHTAGAQLAITYLNAKQLASLTEAQGAGIVLGAGAGHRDQPSGHGPSADGLLRRGSCRRAPGPSAGAMKYFNLRVA